MKKDKIIQNRITEFEMEENLYEVLMSVNVTVSRQVPLSQKRIDIVTCEENIVTAIELKIRDWRGGLRQATVNSIACDLSYVAIWHEYANSILSMESVFSDQGVGLMIIGDDFTPKIAIRAKKKTRKMINNKAYANVKEFLYSTV